MDNQDPHKDPTRIHNIQFLCYQVDRNYLERIRDDDAFAFGLTILRPENEKTLGEVPFQLRIKDDPELVNADNFQGGIFVMASVKPVVLQQALAVGLSWMQQTGRLACDSFYDRNGHEEAPIG